MAAKIIATATEVITPTTDTVVAITVGAVIGTTVNGLLSASALPSLGRRLRTVDAGITTANTEDGYCSIKAPSTQVVGAFFVLSSKPQLKILPLLG
jgi:hypothetical protein